MSKIQVKIEDISFSAMTKERRPTVKLELGLIGGKVIDSIDVLPKLIEDISKLEYEVNHEQTN
jgi:hypothetical protein